jgi:2-dehydropantoate 2-reductase
MNIASEARPAAARGKRIAVVGTGANGAAFGADIARAGLDVTFIEQWPAHVEAIRANGIRIDMPGETQVTPVKAYHLCEVATLREPFDIVLVVVKAYDTRWACELIKPLLRPDALVVGMQNGMTMDDMASIVGPERTLGAVIEIAANMFTPGIVDRQTAPSGTWFGIGAFDERTRGREPELADVLRHCGTVEVVDDIRSAKWMKLVVNASEFLPSAILNLPLAEAVKLPGIHDVMRASGREAIRTGLALGYQLVPILGMERVEANDPDHYANTLLDSVLTGWTRPNTRVTVLQDWMKDRRAEVDDINGLVVREQARLGGSAPVNAALVAIANRIESGELKADPSNAGLLTALLRS